ncbi:DUF262 domain-containing protein [Lentzea sp. HUAS12]|uniref:DUF262 domain-containing protein n=1 Tax=Lentzea sp. HUAS12 TaxID=2951806 RepID=UPI00209E5BEB|nr:DUF262 domain-containing protein [Lentzea sp. HUAS12]USX50817.1 DUF262 domain-containing protein [Lentzea sp. HUAS12]
MSQADMFDVDPDDEVEDVTEEQSEPLVITQEERRLVTQPYDLSLATLVDDIERDRLLLNIEYQRKYVWDRAKASRLIESFLLNIPVPVCYFAENEDGTYEVIDGLQRITTIRDFLEGSFPLRGVSVLHELEGLSYQEMSVKDQRRLQNRTVRCIVITEDSHPDIKFDVFERLNTGSARLVHQELRNCIYRGDLNKYLKELSGKEFFVGILGGLRNHRMDYEELALRFFALYEDFSAYRPPLRQLLNTYMRVHRKEVPDADTARVFEDTCRTVAHVFGKEAFRLHSKGGKSLGAFNKALFDAIMLPFAFADRVEVMKKGSEVRELRESLLRDEDFGTAIGRATADRSRMRLRTHTFAEGLEKIGIKCDLPQIKVK